MSEPVHIFLDGSDCCMECGGLFPCKGYKRENAPLYTDVTHLDNGVTAVLAAYGGLWTEVSLREVVEAAQSVVPGAAPKLVYDCCSHCVCNGTCIYGFTDNHETPCMNCPKVNS